MVIKSKNEKRMKRILAIRNASRVPNEICDEKLLAILQSHDKKVVLRGLLLSLAISTVLHFALKFEKAPMEIVWGVTLAFSVIGIIQTIYDATRVPDYEELTDKDADTVKIS